MTKDEIRNKIRALAEELGAEPGYVVEVAGDMLDAQMRLDEVKESPADYALCKLYRDEAWRLGHDMNLELGR